MKIKHLLLVFLLLTSAWLVAQEDETTQPVDEPAKPFEITNIRESGEATEKLLKKVRELATDTSAIFELDTAIYALKSANPFRFDEDSLTVDYAGMTLWLLKNEANYWRDYESEVQDVLDKINDRYDDLSGYLVDIGELGIRWKLTEKMADTVDLPVQISERITVFANETDVVREAINTHLDDLSMVKNRVEKELKQVGYVRAEINDLSTTQAKNIFSQDAKPLFQALGEDTANFKTVFKIGLKNDLLVLKKFTVDNSNNVFYHVLFSLLFILVLFAMRIHFFKHGLDKLDEYEKAISVFRNPVLSGMAVGVIFSVFFYDDYPRIFVDSMVILSIIPAVILLPKLLYQHLKFFAYFLILLVFFFVSANFLSGSQSEQRLFVLIASIIGIAGFTYALWPKSPMRKALKGTRLGFFLYVIALFAFILLLSLIFNLRGSYQLSVLLSGGVVHSLLVGIAVFISVSVIKAFLTVVIGTGLYGKLNLLLRHKEQALRWLNGILNVLGIYFWLRAVLTGFALLNPFIEAYTEFIDQSWTFGEVTLSMTNVVDFVGVLLIFWVISNIVNLIIKDEILSRFDVRKGLPLAIGILSRYVILFLGFVLAMAAAGISLSKLSILLGALGVGIGFGLQGIVSNLVSGLVIIFERPVHIGDVVTAGSLEGSVIEIGLRSSRIRTWEGAEVIVPNNNLVTNNITNWTYSDKRRRVERIVLIESGPNPRDVKTVIDKVVKQQKGLIDDDQAQAYFLGFENNALKFRVLLWMYDKLLINPSDFLLNLYDALTTNGYKPYIPVQKLLVEQHKTEDVSPIIGHDSEHSKSEETDENS